MIKSVARATVLAFVAGSLNLLCATQAQAAHPVGRGCSFGSISDPNIENSQIGEISGGPVTAIERGTFADWSTVTITCSIHVGNNLHDGVAAVTEKSDIDNDATALLEPRRISYVSPEGQIVALCSEVTIDGSTMYWEADADGWTHDPGAPCVVAVESEPGEPVWKIVADLVNLAFDTAALLGCPILAGWAVLRDLWSLIVDCF